MVLLRTSSNLWECSGFIPLNFCIFYFPALGVRSTHCLLARNNNSWRQTNNCTSHLSPVRLYLFSVSVLELRLTSTLLLPPQWSRFASHTRDTRHVGRFSSWNFVVCSEERLGEDTWQSNLHKPASRYSLLPFIAPNEPFAPYQNSRGTDIPPAHNQPLSEDREMKPSARSYKHGVFLNSFVCW